MLQGLEGFRASAETFKRGEEYYCENKVIYLSVEDGRGYAIVEGSRYYELVFNYSNGEISGLVCSCFCGGNCKHMVAAMLQLNQTLGIIESNYPEQFEQSGSFAAVLRSELLSIALRGKEKGSIIF